MMRRLVVIALSAGLAMPLAGCSSFDPTDLTDWFNTKKPLPGDRRAVFPEGVPGVSQGVPSELVKGAQQPDAAPAEPVRQAAEEPPPPPPKPKAKAPARPKQAARPAPAQPRAPSPAPQQEAQPAPPPQQQQAQQPPVDANWPTIPQSGRFSR